MHIICPALILVCYLQIENGHKLTMKEIIFGASPFYIYIIVYVIEVAVIGEKNGGWPDIYQIMDHMSPIAAVPLLLAFGFGISILVAAVSNLLTRKSKAKMFRYWKDDADPIEVRIEAYGLGVMMGQNMEKNNLSIPLDILEYLADKYGIATEELIKAYIKGFMLGLNEKSK